MSQPAKLVNRPRRGWNKTIDQIMALNPEIVVPGHEENGREYPEAIFGPSKT